jgi:integrase
MKIKNIESLSEEYYKSSDFKDLREKTKVDYKCCMNIMLNTKVDKYKLCQVRVKNMTGARARKAYEIWLERGVQSANHICAVSRKLYSFAMEHGYAETNPFSTFKKKTAKSRKILWTREQLQKFLDVAYSQFEYRNIGLIVQMAYELCQRVGDMRTLTFDCIDFENNILHLEQSKRGAEVHLPIEPQLMLMLKQQKKDYDFQKYVVPYPKARNGKYKPYLMCSLSIIARRILNLANLPKELRISDLRRTGTTELVESGVPMAQIMSVTGHASPQSVQPYIKNTYASAKNALTARKNYGKNI